MESKKPHTSILATFFLGFGVFCVAAIVVLVLCEGSASGTATLPNGTIAKINGPFSASENSTTTVIDAGGHVFEFSPTSISIDKAIVAPLNAGVTSVEIDASYWTTSLRINGSEVPVVR